MKIQRQQPNNIVYWSITSVYNIKLSDNYQALITALERMDASRNAQTLSFKQNLESVTLKLYFDRILESLL